MKLFYRKIGEGQPLIILHGLFGQGDNWNTMAKKFAEFGFEVYLLDLRNHGNSPHDTIWNYSVMSDDILEFVRDLDLKNSILLGHSMGGKVAMLFSIRHPHLVRKLIVSDIAPKYHRPNNESVLNALKAIDLSKINTRKEAQKILENNVSDSGVVQFLLKNIYWKETSGGDKLMWKFNDKIILLHIQNVSEAIESSDPCYTHTLFVRAEKSNYILDSDLESIGKLFPNYTLKTIANAGHWVHADNPSDFLQTVIDFSR